MEYKEFLTTMQMAGATLSNEQIAELGQEAHEKFGVDKDTFMLLLLSGREDFKDWIFAEASKKIGKDLRSAYSQTAKDMYGERLIDKKNRINERYHGNMRDTTHIHP